ncbi:type VI secretion system-associated FHA domain protein TagH [Sphingomonas sp. 1P06PA]|uniref:type VI secretion system-associated FHA domain protein TagH n=1 Tax=Sphingomonas sp. 1P06PA TaxID=554121 RepID=UPI0039A670F3
MGFEAPGQPPRLTLAIRDVERLDNGVPTIFELDQRGAIIGRSPTVDWSLPDPRSHISSRHAEIVYADGRYSLIDVSTNGTFLNHATERSFEAQPLKSGDIITIGHYEIVCTLTGGQAAPAPVAAPQPQSAGWGGWGEAAAAPASASGWDSPAPMSAISGQGPMSGSWAPPPPPAPPAASGWGSPDPAPPAPGGWGSPDPAPPAAGSWGSPEPSPAAGGWGPADPAPASSGWGAAPSAPDPAPPAAAGWGAINPTPAAGGWGAPPPASAPAASGWGGADMLAKQAPPALAHPANPSAWDQPAAAPDPGASGWSSAAPDRPPPPTAENVWGKLTDTNVVDWARGGFGQAAAPPVPAADPLGLSKPAPSAALPAAAPPLRPAPAAPPPATPAPAPSSPGGGPGFDRFLAEAGLSRADLKLAEADALAAAGGLVRRVVAGLVVMLEARARAKAQMGAQSTSLEFDGNNPIKFARTPEQALAQLLNPQERGFMPADRAVEDAFHDLQSHQMATLRAMQGALKATLERFSPAAIRKRAETGGLLQKILPGAKDAALWQAYEREFGGVAQGSDEAFMDVFAKEFKRAYEENAARRPRR